MLPNSQIIIVFDNSNIYFSIILIIGNRILTHHIENIHKFQVEKVFSVLQKILMINKKSLVDLNAIGSCIGPGIFSNIRIAVSTIRGLSLSLGIPVIGISKFNAITYDKKQFTIIAINAPLQCTYLQKMYNNICFIMSFRYTGYCKS